MVKDKIFKVFCSSDMVSKILGSGLIQRCNGCWTRKGVPIYIFLLALSGLFLNSISYGAVIYISSIEELQKIGNDPGYPLDGEYELTQDIDASATRNWNSGAGFAPIGTSSNPFTGKFDGKGHKITGLYINRGSTDYVGLFGFIGPGSEVKNVGIENCYISGNGFVGGLVGDNWDGMVSGSYSMGVVTGSSDVGGLVGWNLGTVSGSYSAGEVTGHGRVGGLMGYNRGTVSNSYAMGSVSGLDYIGGLIGWMSGGSVTNTYSTGLVGGNGVLKGG